MNAFVRDGALGRRKKRRTSNTSLTSTHTHSSSASKRSHSPSTSVRSHSSLASTHSYSSSASKRSHSSSDSGTFGHRKKRRRASNTSSSSIRVSSSSSDDEQTTEPKINRKTDKHKTKQEDDMPLMEAQFAMCGRAAFDHFTSQLAVSVDTIEPRVVPPRNPFPKMINSSKKIESRFNKQKLERAKRFLLKDFQDLSTKCINPRFKEHMLSLDTNKQKQQLERILKQSYIVTKGSIKQSKAMIRQLENNMFVKFSYQSKLTSTLEVNEKTSTEVIKQDPSKKEILKHVYTTRLNNIISDRMVELFGLEYVKSDEKLLKRTNFRSEVRLTNGENLPIKESLTKENKSVNHNISTSVGIKNINNDRSVSASSDDNLMNIENRPIIKPITIKIELDKLNINTSNSIYSKNRVPLSVKNLTCSRSEVELLNANSVPNRRPITKELKLANLPNEILVPMNSESENHEILYNSKPIRSNVKLTAAENIPNTEPITKKSKLVNSTNEMSDSINGEKDIAVLVKSSIPALSEVKLTDADSVPNKRPITKGLKVSNPSNETSVSINSESENHDILNNSKPIRSEVQLTVAENIPNTEPITTKPKLVNSTNKMSDSIISEKDTAVTVKSSKPTRSEVKLTDADSVPNKGPITKELKVANLPNETLVPMNSESKNHDILNNSKSIRSEVQLTAAENIPNTEPITKKPKLVNSTNEMSDSINSEKEIAVLVKSSISALSEVKLMDADSVPNKGPPIKVFKIVDFFNETSDSIISEKDTAVSVKSSKPTRSEVKFTNTENVLNNNSINETSHSISSENGVPPPVKNYTYTRSEVELTASENIPNISSEETLDSNTREKEISVLVKNNRPTTKELNVVNLSNETSDSINNKNHDLSVNNSFSTILDVRSTLGENITVEEPITTKKKLDNDCSETSNTIKSKNTVENIQSKPNISVRPEFSISNSFNQQILEPHNNVNSNTYSTLKSILEKKNPSDNNSSIGHNTFSSVDHLETSNNCRNGNVMNNLNQTSNQKEISNPQVEVQSAFFTVGNNPQRYNIAHDLGTANNLSSIHNSIDNYSSFPYLHPLINSQTHDLSAMRTQSPTSMNTHLSVPTNTLHSNATYTQQEAMNDHKTVLYQHSVIRKLLALLCAALNNRYPISIQHLNFLITQPDAMNNLIATLNAQNLKDMNTQSSGNWQAAVNTQNSISMNTQSSGTLITQQAPKNNLTAVMNAGNLNSMNTQSSSTINNWQAAMNTQSSGTLITQQAPINNLTAVMNAGNSNSMNTQSSSTISNWQATMNTRNSISINTQSSGTLITQQAPINNRSVIMHTGNSKNMNTQSLNSINTQQAAMNNQAVMNIGSSKSMNIQSSSTKNTQQAVVNIQNIISMNTQSSDTINSQHAAINTRYSTSNSHTQSKYKSKSRSSKNHKKPQNSTSTSSQHSVGSISQPNPHVTTQNNRMSNTCCNDNTTYNVYNDNLNLATNINFMTNFGISRDLDLPNTSFSHPNNTTSLPTLPYHANSSLMPEICNPVLNSAKSNYSQPPSNSISSNEASLHNLLIQNTIGGNNHLNCNRMDYQQTGTASTGIPPFDQISQVSLNQNMPVQNMRNQPNSNLEKLQYLTTKYPQFKR